MIKYENYKPTELEWIGEVPLKWNILRVKDYSYLKARIGWQGLRSDEFIENTVWYRVTGTDFNNGSIEWVNCYCVEKELFDQDKKIQLKLNDLLITKDGTIGKIALIKSLPKQATLNSGVFVTRPLKNKYCNDFMFWLLSSDVFTRFLDYNKNGSTILHLYQNVFERFFYSFPSETEQIYIAQYLDTKTQNIDKKTNLLTKKAETYKELRKSIINAAVCKGLDKNVKLKESEVRIVPIHWRNGRIKDISKTMSSGATPHTNISAYYEKGILNWDNTGDLNDDAINECQYKISEVAIRDYPNLKVNKIGTLLIAMYGSTICKIGLLNNEATTNQACCCINFKKDSYSTFIFYWFLANKSKIISLSVGGTQPNISQGIIAKLLMAIPQLEEQTAIANYLDEKTQKIDAIVSNIGKQIDTLKELRKTLINDTVTGKIKVVV